MLKLSISCTRLDQIIIVVQVGAGKIYSSSSKENETNDETQFTTKIGGKTSLGPNYFFL
jgi:hypothetical protein